ncbi:MAG: Do family serine endopeptidase [Chitinispirillia bacterium]|nr:Do family serine endopeptidase [Chitinispirillia bacterium]MCL2240920.1 Do family serine endopeptidase [Chitinispirillia bacterium]
MSIPRKPKAKTGAIRLVSSTAVLLFAASALLFASGNSSSAKRPNRGSVNFGASSSPGVSIPPALQSFTTVFADVAEKVVPTVVSVVPTKIDTVVFGNNPFYQFFNDPFFGGNPFEDFFGGRQRRGPSPQQQPQRQERRRQGLGSGVIVSRDGYILTNSHVVEGADEVEVRTSDGRSFAADIVGQDSLTDVAVLKIRDKVNNLPVAFLGDSDKLRPGDWAVAVGNPFSLTSSVTMGIVSALDRTTGAQGGGAATYQNFIQTDAAINPGNSGGALVNIKGELIGINTMIYTQSGGNMGIGFAIPINMARRIMEDLIYDGKVSRGWLGVSIQELDQTTRDAFGLSPDTRGVLIGDVFKDQPGDKAGIRRGDVVTSINGKATETLNQLRNSVAAIHPGKTVPVEILRNGKKMTVQVKLTARDESAANVPAGGTSGDQQAPQPTDGEFLGMKAGPLTKELRDQLNLPATMQGVVVTEVARGSQAAQEGLRVNDIILEMNRKPVAAMKDFTQIARGVKPGDSLLLLVQREGSTFFRAVKVRK